jgi:hypothetical protein
MNNKIQVSLDWDALLTFVKDNPSCIYAGKKRYVSLTLWANDGPDQFGNDFSVKPRASKATMDAKTKLPFVGNAKIDQGYTKPAPKEESPF